MSVTLRQSDGDLYINSNTGRPDVIDKFDKVNQDVAEAILSDYDIDRDLGSELNSVQTIPANYGGIIGKGLISTYISSAINRLMNKQKTDAYLTEEETIEKIKTIFVDIIQLTDVYFYLEVQTAKEQLLGKEFGWTPKPVSLQHLNANRSAYLDK